MKRIIQFLALLSLVACTSESDFDRILSYENDANTYGQMLISMIKQQPQSVQNHYFDKVTGKTILLSHTDFVASSEYGASFIVPYSNGIPNSFDGILICPISQFNQDRSVDTKKPSTIKIDNTALHSNIDGKKQFIYSYYMKRLADKTNLTIGEGLDDYTYLLNNPQPLNEDDNHEDNDSTSNGIMLLSMYPSSFAGSNYLHIEYDYFAQITSSSGSLENGDFELTVVASSRALENSVKEVLRIHFLIPISAYEIFSNTNHFEVNILSSFIPINNYTDFTNLFMQYVSVSMHQKGYDLIGQYFYEEHNYNNSGSSGNAGSGTGGNSGSNLGGNQNLGNIDVFDNAVLDCNSINNSDLISQNAHSLINNIQNIPSMRHDGSPSNSWNDYVTTVNNDPSIEHGIAVNEYPNQGYYLGRISDGNAFNTEIEYERFPVADIHNHPNKTPPSPLDLLNALKHSCESESFKASLVFNEVDNSFYSIQINQRDGVRFNELYNDLRTQIDPETNNFTEGGRIENLILSHKSSNLHLNFNEQILYNLIAFFKINNLDISILKYENEGITVYGLKEVNGKLVPIKCE